MDLSDGLSALKMRLIEAMQWPTDDMLPPVVDYYLGLYTQDPDFADQGVAAKSRKIDGWLEKAGRRFLKVPVTMCDTPLRRVGNDVLHNRLEMEGHDASVFYFEDEDRRLVAVDVSGQHCCLRCPP